MNSSATLTNRILPWRIWVFIIAVGFIFGIFLLRIFDYQILQGEEYKAFAEENRISEISLSTLSQTITRGEQAKNGFPAIGKVQFCDDALRHGSFRIPGAYIRSGSGQHYEPCYLAVARA